jgi:hypothetical protein
MPRALSDSQEQEAARRYAAGEESTSIAQSFQVDPRTVRAAIIRQGIAIRNKREAALVHIDSPIRHITPDEWHALYWGEDSGLPSVPDLAKILGVETNTVRFSLLAAGIPIRGRGSYGHKVRGRSKLHADEIDRAVELYAKGTAFTDIARALSSTDDIVHTALRNRLGGPLRSSRPWATVERIKAQKRRSRVERQRLRNPLYGSREKGSTPKAMVQPSVIDIAWAAGFMEGEAHFSPTAASVHVYQVNREPLDRLQYLFGGSVLKGPTRYEDNPRRQPQCIWQVTGTRGRGVSMTVYPFMSAKRQSQIRVGLSHWRSKG